MYRLPARDPAARKGIIESAVRLDNSREAQMKMKPSMTLPNIFFVRIPSDTSPNETYIKL